MPPRRAEEKLAEVGGAAGDVTANEVGVHLFEGGGRKDAACENAVAESGSEALDLRFEGFEHVDGGTVGDVTVGPGGVLPCRRTRGIEATRLREQDERAFGVAPLARIAFGGSDFCGAAAEMHGGGAHALGRAPRNGILQRVVDLEDASTVAVFREPAHEARGKMAAGHARQLIWRYVAERGVITGELGQFPDARGSLDRAAQRCQMPAQRVGDGLRAAARNGPADRVRGGGKDHSESSA